MERRSVAAALVWAAAAVAVAGAVVIGFWGSGRRPVALGLAVAVISVTASAASTRAAASAAQRTFAAGVACGAALTAAIGGIASFGLWLLPAVIAWAAGLRMVDHPPDARQVGATGVVLGVSLGSLALIAASSL